ncbi:MAG: hypothetical protein MI919_02250 [Holophagales bacterium]|nr:hypothetical protein [Holophagales bacterium]
MLISTSHLTLQGVSLDNDSDGRLDEDWADGIDNDGDGAVDEDDWDTVLRGVADASGEPERVSGENALWNRGLVDEGITGTVVRPTIRGLRFSTFQRAVAVVPEWGTPTGGCGDRFFTGGGVYGLTLEANRFDNNVLGSLAASNSITGALFPVDLAGAGGQTAVLHTRISGGVNGLSFAPGASGYLAAGLEIQGTFFEAVVLEAGTSGNTVLHFGDPLTALDLGTDNKLIGNFVP